MKVFALAFGHGGFVAFGAGDGAVATDHVEHFLLGLPDGESGDGARQADGGDGERCAGVIADEFFDGASPPDETRDLGEFHARQSDRDDRGSRVLLAYGFRESGELADVAPTALELHANVPAVGEGAAELRIGQEVIDGIFAFPSSEHGEVSELHPLRRQERCAESHFGEAFSVVEAGDFLWSWGVAEGADGGGEGGFGEVEGEDGHLVA